MALQKFLIAWANAPYAIVLGTVFLFALLQASGLLGLLAGGDHDGGDDVDGADADGHDVDGHEADHDGGDADHDADHDGDHDNESEGRGVASVLLAPLGIGKLPFSLVWQVYGAVFALTGFALNARWVTSGAPPLVSLAWTMPLALAAGYGTVAGLAKLLSPIFVDKNAEATSRAQLVGQVGTVISTKVDGDFGEVRIRDKTGHDLRVVCKLAAGHRAAREGESVVVVEHENGNLYVASMEEALTESEVQEESNVRS